MTYGLSCIAFALSYILTPFHEKPTPLNNHSTPPLYLRLEGNGRDLDDLFASKPFNKRVGLGKVTYSQILSGYTSSPHEGESKWYPLMR